ncbi:hypothetical protein BaRGS_00020476 [Batillaria attramentaria]|uniref:Uncharacterized protein n=1 Tax=Batillaria attramentaria TaxID=370345 RepID=A0ABD0KMI7_9CAEN
MGAGEMPERGGGDAGEEEEVERKHVSQNYNNSVVYVCGKEPSFQLRAADRRCIFQRLVSPQNMENVLLYYSTRHVLCSTAWNPICVVSVSVFLHTMMTDEFRAWTLSCSVHF